MIFQICTGHSPNASTSPGSTGSASRSPDSDGEMAAMLQPPQPGGGGAGAAYSLQAALRISRQPGRRDATGLLQLNMPMGAATVSAGAAPLNTFISFQEEGVDIGSIQAGRGGRGLTLTSSAGDFAEWHMLTPEQLRAGTGGGAGRQLAEGDVVGFTPSELIGLKTSGTDIVGVVSRCAAVEGSTPAAPDRPKFELVAYTGRVPVKVRGLARFGDVLGPSGYNDGTAAVTHSSWLDAVWACHRSPHRSEQRLGVVVGQQKKVRSRPNSWHLPSRCSLVLFQYQHTDATRVCLIRSRRQITPWSTHLGSRDTAVAVADYTLVDTFGQSRHRR